MSERGSAFAPDCRRCSRLSEFLDIVRLRHPGYHAAPVPAFGDPAARLLVVGLAPGLHGANRTGRPFTGDHAGILLYETLNRHGFCDRPASVAADDGLRLHDCRISNAVRCVPPQNRPRPEEIAACNAFLAHDLAPLQAGSVVVALGRVAHTAVLRAVGEKPARFDFAHGAEHRLGPGTILLDSYHCSRYNTQTRRLTPEMFDAVFVRARVLLDA